MERFDRLDRILDNNGLFTMARRTRLCPTYTEDNPTRQTKEVVTFNGDLVTIIKADNFTLWAHDMRRLNHILDQAFGIESIRARGALESVGFPHLMQTDGEFRPFLKSER